jgi:predicted Zn-dependent protease
VATQLAQCLAGRQNLLPLLTDGDYWDFCLKHSPLAGIKKYAWIIVIFLMTSCSGSDGTFTLLPLSADIYLGDQATDEILSSGEVEVLDRDEYPEAYHRLEVIKNNLLNSGEVFHKEDFNWNIHIIHDDSVLNAFCLPGGNIFVYTGLIKFLDSEDELAGVLGHEIAHADLRHASNQITKSMGLSLLIRIVFGFDHSTLLNIASGLLNLSFSRAHEQEADEYSVLYLTHTPYDARGVMRFFEKMSEQGKDPGIVEFLSTHPAPDNRIGHIMARWKELGGKPGQRFSKEYQELKRSLP